MEKLGWFWNNEWRQRDAINQAAEELDVMRAERAGDTSALTRLFNLDRAQAQEIARLRVTVEVLANLLIESGAVDEKTLRYRIEARWSEYEAAQPPAPKLTAYETLGARPPDDPTKP